MTAKRQGDLRDTSTRCFRGCSSGPCHAAVNKSYPIQTFGYVANEGNFFDSRLKKGRNPKKTVGRLHRDSTSAYEEKFDDMKRSLRGAVTMTAGLLSGSAIPFRGLTIRLCARRDLADKRAEPNTLPVS